VTEAYAPGKVILVGEHAVVYGRPAVAVPVFQASDLGRTTVVGQGKTDKEVIPLEATILGVLRYLDLGLDHDLTITVDSTIPIARGLGSGAAVSTAVARALAQHFSVQLSAEEVSQLVYEVEKFHHGTPSGIDNTVVAYEQPVFFVRGRGITRLSVGAPLNLVIADTGVVSSTRRVVSDVRRRWSAEAERYEGLFDEIGGLARLAKSAIERGDPNAVGRLMDENHELLMTLGVSSPELDKLAEAARMTGALGAKMSGAGWGGNMLALVEAERTPKVAGALHAAGAVSTIFSQIS
jgi:mevalonate kinase